MKNQKFKAKAMKSLAGVILLSNLVLPVVASAEQGLITPDANAGISQSEIQKDEALSTPKGEGLDKEMTEIGDAYNEEANFPDPSELVKELEKASSKDKENFNGEGDFESSSAQDEINKKLQEDMEKSSMPQLYSFRAAAPAATPRYANVNNYIAQKKFANPIIQTDSRINNLPKYNYYNGKPIGIVVHYTANRKSTIYNEVDFMYRNYPNAFVHGYVNKDRVIQTADTRYLSWGAGPNANPYFINIELCFEGTFDGFARSVNNNAYYMATLLKKHNLKPSYGENNGKGTILSHAAISKFYGGTNHTDPIAYFNEYGYDMKQFYDLIATKYAEITNTTPPTKPTNDKITGDYHIVKKGETLYNISTRSGKSVDNIKKWNGLKSNTIEVGQKLWLKEQPKPSGITVKSDVPTTEWMTIVKDVDYAEKAEGLPGRVVKGNTKSLPGKNVKVTRVAELSNGTKHKRISQNNKDLGWVKADALVPTSSLKEDTIKSSNKNVEWKTIKSDTPIWNKAEGLKGAKSIGNTKSLYSKNVKVQETVVTSSNKEYKKIYQSNKEVGWVLASSLVETDAVKSTVPVTKWDKIKRNTPIYNDQHQTKVTGNTSSLKSKNIKVTEVATYKLGKKMIMINQSNKPIGWILAEDTEKPTQY